MSLPTVSAGSALSDAADGAQPDSRSADSAAKSADARLSRLSFIIDLRVSFCLSLSLRPKIPQFIIQSFSIHDFARLYNNIGR